MTTTEQDELLSIGAVARLTGWSPSTARRWCDANLPGSAYRRTPGGHRRISRAALTALLEPLP